MATPDRKSSPRERTEVLTPKSDGLGTFGGVFTPSILTILGVIMYLRFGWVVGNVGLGGTLLIVTLSTGITFLTALSIAAIATDQRVRIGGAYYMISRSLGIEPGGAVGIPLYLAQGLSVALYTVGFAESLTITWPSLNAKWTAIVTTLIVAILAMTSAKAAIRSQYFILGAIALSLISFAFGGPVEPGAVQAVADGAAPGVAGFWVVFAVFFPAVTGIMAGVNLSGDLADPGRSIPRGTFAAVGTGYVIYMIIPVFLSMRAESADLIADPLIMMRMSAWGDAILIGVWGATLSSAVGSILGAPRVLQALARDGVLPEALRWVGKGSGEDDNPRIGTFVTLGIALVAVSLGDLNVIAPVLTMFFLTTYGVLNIAAGLERFLGSPSFRPRFKVHWSLSLLGAVGCFAVMLLINAAATAVAALLALGVFLWLERRGLRATWGDVRRGIWLALARTALLNLDGGSDPKNWRPHLLVLSGAPTRRWHLIELATSISHQKGLLTVSSVVPSESVSLARQGKLETNIRDYMARRGVHALVRVISARDTFAGAEQLVDTYGLGALVPNTILLGESKEGAHRDRYCAMVRHFFESRRNVLIVRAGDSAQPRGSDRIDIWWGGLHGNGALMLILGYLLESSLAWSGSEVRLKMVVPSESAAREARPNLEELTRELRTGASVEVLVAGGRPFDQILQESSRDAGLVLLGMAPPGEDFTTYYEGLQSRTQGLPDTVFVLAAEEITFREVLLDAES